MQVTSDACHFCSQFISQSSTSYGWAQLQRRLGGDVQSYCVPVIWGVRNNWGPIPDFTKMGKSGWPTSLTLAGPVSGRSTFAGA